MVENSTDPCLRIGTFPELDPQTLDLKKAKPYTLICHSVSTAANY